MKWTETSTFFRLIELLIAAIAVVLTYQLHRIIHHIKRDAGLREMGNIHKEFWSDDKCAEVRTWIACDKAYEGQLQETLKMRLQDLDEGRATAHSLTLDKYQQLDKLDRFFNLLLRIKAIDPDFGVHKGQYDMLFLSYWIKRSAMRVELYGYVKKFYPSLIEEFTE